MTPERNLPLFELLGDPEQSPPPPAEAHSAPLAARTRVPADHAARRYATDPANNVVLEASAGTGKTSVLVERYGRLLKAGVNPANILAITFTRKAAAEMRDRIVQELRDGAARGEIPPARWRDLRDRLPEIAISTIDAFCLSLLREFPLEADLDPGFAMADETEVPHLVDLSLDGALRICRSIARDDPAVALVFAELDVRRIRLGLAHLLDRRLIAPVAIGRFLAGAGREMTADLACRRAAQALAAALAGAPGGRTRFLEDGPRRHPAFAMLASDLGGLEAVDDPAAIRAILDRVRPYFFSQKGEPRRRSPHRKGDCDSAAAWIRHSDAMRQIAPVVGEVLARFRHDLNLVLARGVQRMLQVALTEYHRTLEAHAVIDFSEALSRALDLLRRMDEFAQSRYRLESRYHHVLVDEFQDTSRAQWELISLLIQSWGEGLGLVHDRTPVAPSIFIVGDRKQSIYRFRDAEVAVLEEAGRHIAALRPDGGARRWISHSFRAVPALLALVNDLFDEIGKLPGRDDGFRYDERDRFPVDPEEPEDAGQRGRSGPVVGLAASETIELCASTVGDEILRVLAEESVRDRATGVTRAAEPGDIAILFRSRESHREYEQALQDRGIPAYVYKGLGFFDSDEVKDVCVLMRYLADPGSDARAAAFLRSRLVRLSDEALARLAPRIGQALTGPALPAGAARLSGEDREVLDQVRASLRAWLPLADTVPPAELIDRVLSESAYEFELEGSRRVQARENLKKLRGLIRRIQNRGYATIGRIAGHIDRLSAGDESNAVVDATGAVSLMTVHAAKGLEFPVVFLVNLNRGTGGSAPPIRIAAGDPGEASVSVGSFQSEADADERAREREESKRLLYVALTRARDRLYLSSLLKNGQLRPGKGSLAEVLPESFLAIFGDVSAAPGSSPSTVWRSSGGTVHEIGICRHGPARHASGEASTSAERPFGSFEPLPARERTRRVSVTEAVSPETSRASEADLPGSDRLLGVVMHRLLQADADLPPSMDVRERILSVLRADERATLELPERWAERAAVIYRRDDLGMILRGKVLHELPFSMTRYREGQSTILRGRIDCLVQRPDGGIVVLEYKSGARRPEHTRQLELYVEAARLLFPGCRVDGLLVHAEPPASATAAAVLDP